MLAKKKDVGLRYQETLYKLIYFGLKGYGLYQNANCMVSSFLALVFFRVPIFRLFFFAVIEFEDNYSKMEKTLMDIQKEIEPKTSFSSNFA